MSKTIELKISDEVYERAEAIAKESNRSLDAVLTEALEQEFRPMEQLEIETELKVLELLDAESLWGVYNLTYIAANKYFLDNLQDFSRLWLLNKGEKTTLKRTFLLVESSKRVRAEVERLLRERGWPVD